MLLLSSFCLAEDMSSPGYSLDVDAGQVNYEESSSPNYRATFDVIGEGYEIDQQSGSTGGGGGGGYSINQVRVVEQLTITEQSAITTVPSQIVSPTTIPEVKTTTTLRQGESKPIGESATTTTLVQEQIPSIIGRVIDYKPKTRYIIGSMVCLGVFLILAVAILLLKQRRPLKPRGLAYL